MGWIAGILREYERQLFIFLKKGLVARSYAIGPLSSADLMMLRCTLND